MSLNGLDAPQVLQAYQAALAEAGGWLFLKYVSRDEVELLGTGKNGVTEARAAIAEYPDLSPLYGLIMYRRRKVVIKYIPEGTSRLLIARTTVHLQAVQEKFAPYETLLEVTNTDGLTDTSLAAAFPLHTAMSMGSNQLDEITEDAEEPGPPRQDGETRSITSAPSIRSRKMSSEKWKTRRAHSPVPPASPVSDPTPAPASLPAAARYTAPPTTSSPLAAVSSEEKRPASAHKQSISRFLVREEAGRHSVTQLTSHETHDYERRPSQVVEEDTSSVLSDGTTHESSSTKPASSDAFDYDKYYEQLYKPKVKLGPRPVNVGEINKRTRVSILPPSAHTRPVASLPAGHHQSKPKSVESAQQTRAAPPNSSVARHFQEFPQPPPVPESISRPGSRGSNRSIPLSIKTSKSTMTPEKLRLMKAMELRKKQMRKSLPAEDMADSPMPEPFVPGSRKPSDSADGEEHVKPTSSKADSGIELDYRPLNDSAPFSNLHEDSMVELGQESVQRLPDSRDAAGAEGGKRETEPPASAEEVISKTQLGSPTTISAISAGQTSPSGEGALSSNLPNLQKLRGWVEPSPLHVSTDHPPPETEHNYLSDEDFMEELQSATFQRATSVSIQRSPASPIFPIRRPSASARSIASENSTATFVSGVSALPITVGRSGSTTEPGKPLAQKTSSGTLSIEYQNSRASARTPEPEHGDCTIMSRRSNVSSGISKRIQALAEKSARDADSARSSSPSSVTDRSSSLGARKTSLQGEHRGAFAAPARPPTGKLSVWPSTTPSPAAPQAPQGVTVHKTGDSRESISVTARIVRQPQTPPSSSSSSTELHHSQLLINHTRPTHSHDFPTMTAVLSGSTRVESETSSRPPSEPHSRPLSPAFSHSSVDSNSANRRKSFDRRSVNNRFRAGSESSRKTSKAPSIASVTSDGQDESKKASRTSRFFKRISTMGGSRRESVSQASNAVPEKVTEEHNAPPMPAPAVVEPPASPPRKDSVPDFPPPLVVGDINVQFPDTLLWKRRWAEIDHEGNLVFMATRPVSSMTNGKHKQFVTKFHLSELRAPYIPDVDRQEMPNSVLFDLAADGATLSCANEDAMAQRQLLALLRTYHQAWAGKA